MKKVTFLVPTYNTHQYIEERKEMWKTISSLVELIIVEDKKTEDAKKIAKEIGARYYSKKNGNWGSVVNFAVSKKLIKTEYITIMDPDDMINIEELVKVIGNDFKADVIAFNQENLNINSNENYIQKFNNNLFIHHVFVKTEIFNTTPKLPEGISWTDALLMAHLSKNVSIQYFNNAPYIYIDGYEGQSMNIKIENLKNKLDKVSEIENSIILKDFKPKGMLEKKAYYSARYVSLFLIRGAYDSETNRAKLKDWKALYIDRLKTFKKTPISTKLIWSQMYRFFKR